MRCGALFKWLFPLLFLLFVIVSCNHDIDNFPPAEKQDNEHYVVVFGDIQMYTYGWAIKYYQSSIDWILKQIDNGLDICAVLQVGDITQDNIESQWQAFRDVTISLAERVPFFVCTGNHDYQWKGASKIHNRNSTLINEYAHFPLADQSIVEYYEGNSLENYISKIHLGKDIINLLVMEFGPREKVVEWACSYVQNHNNERFILMTHEWLSAKGERMQTGTTAELQFEGYSSYSTPEVIWERLVKDNDNMACVICGHEENFSCLYQTVNAYGRPIPQILFNLQFLPNGGNGIVQIWSVKDNDDGFHVCAYDTLLEDWYLPESTSYYVPIRY